MKTVESTIRTVQLTEKASRLSGTDNQYFFEVDPNANKLEIKRAVEALFNVKVEKVCTLNRMGKRKRDRRMRMGKKSDWKRAVVTLRDGQSIDFTS